MERLRQVELLKRAKLKRVMQRIESWNILQGDEVMVIAGKEKGRTGVVKEVIRKMNQVRIEGLNLVRIAAEALFTTLRYSCVVCHRCFHQLRNCACRVRPLCSSG